MTEKWSEKCQYGKESAVAHGTGVVATRIFPGVVKVPADRTPVHPQEMTGSKIQSRRTVINQILVDGISMSMDSAQFQSLLMAFACGLKGAVTGSEQTSNMHDYLSDFTPSWTTANNPDSISLEVGDANQAREIDYCMVKSIKLSGKMGAGEFVKVELELFGKSTDPTTFTAGLLPDDGELMLADMLSVWIDANWALLGTTQYTTLVREYSVEIQTGNHPKFFAAGVKTMSGHGEGSPEMIITLTMDENTDANTFFAGYQAASEYAIRMLWEGGPTLPGGKNHSLQIDCFGAFDEVVPMGAEDNGDNLSTGIFVATGDRGGVPQVETATAAGTCTGNGNMTCIVTGAGITGSPKTLNVAVLNNDTPTMWAAKVRAALNLDAAISALYLAGGTGTAIKLTRKVPAADDGTLNIALATGTASGITAAPTSANTTAGVLSSATEHKFGVAVCTDRATM